MSEEKNVWKKRRTKFLLVETVDLFKVANQLFRVKRRVVVDERIVKGLVVGESVVAHSCLRNEKVCKVLHRKNGRRRVVDLFEWIPFKLRFFCMPLSSINGENFAFKERNELSPKLVEIGGKYLVELVQVGSEREGGRRESKEMVVESHVLGGNDFNYLLWCISKPPASSKRRAQV